MISNQRILDCKHNFSAKLGQIDRDSTTMHLIVNTLPSTDLKNQKIRACLTLSADPNYSFSDHALGFFRNYIYLALGIKQILLF